MEMARRLLYLRRAQSGLAHQFTGEKTKMKNTMLKLYIKLQSLLSQEEGQDLVEYALVVALIALAATVGMNSLAGAINTGFTNIGTTLSSSIT
jgi:pilus assembly protein Flp/PilA